MEACARGGAFSVTTTSTFPAAAWADGASASAAARMRRPRFRSEMVRLHWAVCADVAELVDAHGSGPCGGNPVEVQVLSSAYRKGSPGAARRPRVRAGGSPHIAGSAG